MRPEFRIKVRNSFFAMSTIVGFTSQFGFQSTASSELIITHSLIHSQQVVRGEGSGQVIGAALSTVEETDQWLSAHQGSLRSY